MERKLFKGLPDSFLLSSIPFFYLIFYLFYISLRGTALNIFEFYTLSLIPILFIIGVRGRELFDILGFDLNNAPLHIVILRFLIIAFVGISFGFLVYKIGTSLFLLYGIQIFPFDLFYLQLTSGNPLPQTFIDTLIVAFFEETIRIVPILGYANAFYKRGFSEGESIIYSVLFGSLFFVFCHYFAWGGLNILNVFVMTMIVVFMTLIGWFLYSRNLWGFLTFREYSIISPMFAHFIYDLSIALSLRVIPSPLALIFGIY